MANRSRTIYTGVTNNLEVRVHQHKTLSFQGFTRKYGVTRLVYFESFRNVDLAIRREKQIKGWKRCKKLALISAFNPEWRDLAVEERTPLSS
ncbi:MAG: GIY-YIG nuclease family protein [Planctomycetes bacterium]|nr:GIY-YIG nuclease family protein [Planctomycetota bacterium]